MILLPQDLAGQEQGEGAALHCYLLAGCQMKILSLG